MLKRIRSFIKDSLTVVNVNAPDPHTIQLAAAILLVEVMHADHHIKLEEKKSISKGLGHIFELTAEESDELLEIAEDRARDVVSLHEFATIINRSFQMKGKLKLMEQIWRVVFSDMNMDKYEEYLVRRIADLLYISHTDYIRTRNQEMNKR
ncbi:MAG: TerB family tellurite resistance protein [Gammaproteobacteria bacterium]|nr:TerB family tellurite resistance protein [Gammaproteobacteria bacterium]